MEQALAYAKDSGKSWLQMTSDNFPLTGAAKYAIDRAFAVTQKAYGMCLLKGFPVDRWSVEDARLVNWGIGLNVGVARTQNRASQVMNDVRDEGGSYKVKMPIRLSLGSVAIEVSWSTEIEGFWSSFTVISLSGPQEQDKLNASLRCT